MPQKITTCIYLFTTLSIRLLAFSSCPNIDVYQLHYVKISWKYVYVSENGPTVFVYHQLVQPSLVWPVLFWGGQSKGSLLYYNIIMGQYYRNLFCSVEQHACTYLFIISYIILFLPFTVLWLFFVIDFNQVCFLCWNVKNIVSSLLLYKLEELCGCV